MKVALPARLGFALPSRQNAEHLCAGACQTCSTIHKRKQTVFFFRNNKQTTTMIKHATNTHLVKYVQHRLRQDTCHGWKQGLASESMLFFDLSPGVGRELGGHGSSKVVNIAMQARIIHVRVLLPLRQPTFQTFTKLTNDLQLHMFVSR